MARLPFVDENTNPELNSLISQIRGERGGKLLNLFKVLLNSPQVAEGWLHLFTVIRQQCILPAQYRELAIMAVAVLNRAEYEYQTHLKPALEAGLTVEQLARLEDWRYSGLFDKKQRAVLDYTETITRAIRVPDEVFGEIRENFNNQEIVEMTVTIAGYNLVSRFLEALQIDPEPDRVAL